MSTLADAIAMALSRTSESGQSYQPAIVAFFNLANTLIKSFVNTTSDPADGLCEYCLARPKHRDGDVVHPFCEKECAAQDYVCVQPTEQAPNQSSGNQTGETCDFCHSRPKYSSGKTTHPFCSRTCAKNAKKCAKSEPQENGSPLSDVCLLCRTAPKQIESHFCGKACADEAEKKAPMVLKVPEDHVTFASVANQFTASWRHSSKTCPKVRVIYKVISPASSIATYDEYRARVEERGNFVAAGRTAGNECRRWHGCQRECKLGNPGKTKLCSSSTCSLCCILRTSFDISCFGKTTGWGRFGKGIYTSSTSSKSASYVKTSSSSKFKPMLLNKVVVAEAAS
ncbi:hypothetical protein SERLADRAFT_477146 [Serpula lacrymans var. lacrymans S7.9]|uniref:PARP catalytic domain-containing protein n=1 Tax=Serpula lacrymans var. lacrymans (strain S7.9) TaxID=578457 RepID=F8P8F5_SERL9|nr:uncharacterized protein SERLADRAFT_477146 [Serpula lacrymans var. lacrymans S7.9]EGO20711.1 hypothetical protein SERLADRAFT_477146 [Serpula lacrymans var. lacrymans S7.9]